MKIFKKQSNEVSEQNAIPGVFALLRSTHRAVSPHRVVFAGYAAWTILPALATFGASFLSVPSSLSSLLTNGILVGDILLSTWVGGCLTLFGISVLRNEALTDREVSTRVRKAMPTLLYLFAFVLFCVIAGTYLLLIPGICAFVWLAFVNVAALEQPGTSFSQALKKSRAMSKGMFFRTLWRIAVGNLFFGMIYFALCIVFLGAALSFAHINPTELVQTVISTGSEFPAWISLLLSSLSLPLMPYTATYNVALYDALKTR